MKFKRKKDQILFFLDKLACFKLKIGYMVKFRLSLLLIVILFFIVTTYASDFKDDRSDKQPVISSLSDNETNNRFIYTVSDYSYNEVADKAVKKNITLFKDKLKEKFSIWLSRSGKYLEMMKGILKEKNIPEEIVFLPLIESGFNPYAYSRARAVGYWQFISSTAKRYGLEINWWKDERRDPVKSTVAAADYLKDLYEIFGSWNLAMAAYNAGEGKILRALNKTKTDNYWELLNSRYIKRETRNYVPKFIAASLIANNPENFGFEDIEYHAPLNYDEVRIDSAVDFEVIAKCAETSVEVIKELNPELRRWCTPPDVSEYILRVPMGKGNLFLENLSQIREEERFTVDTYKVMKGDTIIRISKKTGVPVKVILDLNSSKKLRPLKAGTSIFLPPKDKLVLDTDDRATIRNKKRIKRDKFKKI